MKRRCRDRQSPERYRVASTVRERINPIARSGINRRSLEVAPSEALLGRERGRKVGGPRRWSNVSAGKAAGDRHLHSVSVVNLASGEEGVF